MRSVCKLTWRSVKTFFGRYMALLLIVAISVGFFAGLKITTDAMIHTGDLYLTEQRFYDFRLFSTLGFTEEDVEGFSALEGVETAEGTRSVDALVTLDGNHRPFKLMALTERINLPSLVAGRMPTAADECLADAKRFDEDDIGTVIRLSEENEEGVFDALNESEYTIVGLCESPLYLGTDRGTTGIGSGALHAFLYLPQDCFAGEVYTEINIKLTEDAEIYSDAYEALIEAHKQAVTTLCRDRAADRYDGLVGDVLRGMGLPADSALTPEIRTVLAESGVTEPETYVLTRAENAGYVSFENDTAIVGGVANIFPVFFILIAMLVCMTTMTRMVDEERTQIGTLKAMGFGNGRIMAKYLLYAGSATLIGWAIGYFVCTWGLPQIFWFAYSALYTFSSMPYLFSPTLALITLAVSLVGILGATWISCRKELVSVPARLIRPKAAKSGKRIFLERITPLWRRLPFLQKITLRNMFRYRRRLFMMLIGIGCCAGLVVTAFGVRDSMIDIGSMQYEEIQKYEIEASFDTGNEGAVCEKLEGTEGIADYLTASVDRVDLLGEEMMSSVSLMSFRDTERVSDFWGLTRGGTGVGLPGKNEVVINNKISEKLGLSVGDTLEIRNADMQTCSFRVSGIFDNYLYNYVLLSAETYADAFGEWQANTALLKIEGESERMATVLTEMEEITSVSQLSVTEEIVNDALSCLDYIIWLVVLFSGALAFVVIFNLTNINLAERSREIATVEVLGFYPKETNSYVLRENLILSVIAGLLGLPLGTLFHRIVMGMIVIDSFAFRLHVTPVSYLLAFVCTLLFAVIVNLFMRRQIGKIKMAESLKAVE